MPPSNVVGLKPWLPSFLARSPWWTEPIAAQRLASLRIGVGLTLLLDVLGTYLPRASDFFGAGSLSAPGTFTTDASPLVWHRQLLERIQSPEGWRIVLLIWALSALLLCLGLLTRLAVIVAWFISITVTHINPFLHNSGDQVRNILLLYLIVTPCAAVWSLPAWWKRRAGPRLQVLTYPWAVRLLLIQLAAIYFMNGLYKLRGPHWHGGAALSYVLGDVSWTRWSFASWPMPEWLLVTATWVVLVWELGFPLFVFMPALRGPALWLGVAFHLGTGLTMRLGPFPLYVLCLYLPLVPWERGAPAGQRSHSRQTRPAWGLTRQKKSR